MMKVVVHLKLERFLDSAPMKDGEENNPRYATEDAQPHVEIPDSPAHSARRSHADLYYKLAGTNDTFDDDLNSTMMSEVSQISTDGHNDMVRKCSSCY